MKKNQIVLCPRQRSNQQPSDPIASIVTTRPRKTTQPVTKKLHKSRTATGMDGTLPKCNFENLKPVEISKNSFGII